MITIKVFTKAKERTTVTANSIAKFTVRKMEINSPKPWPKNINAKIINIPVFNIGVIAKEMMIARLSFFFLISLYNNPLTKPAKAVLVKHVNIVPTTEIEKNASVDGASMTKQPLIKPTKNPDVGPKTIAATEIGISDKLILIPPIVM